MAYAEDLYNRLTSGMTNTDQYLAKLSDRGQPTETETEALRQMMQGQAPQSPIAQRGMPTQAETNTLRQMMTPNDQAAYFKSFEDAGINLTPGAGIARGLLNMDQAITNATTAPNVLQQNQLQNIATGQSNVSPYGLGLGQQMYNPEMLRGLLGF